jgi:glycosyltransferase involved in cell wall biosynthesis
MAEFWKRIDVLVLPSLTQPHAAEQFGRVLIEAMANGVAVIGSTTGGIPEAIGEAGIVVPEGDANALAAAIERVRSDPGLRAELIAKGRERVDRVYHHDILAARTIAFYESLLSPDSQPARISS